MKQLLALLLVGAIGLAIHGESLASTDKQRQEQTARDQAAKERKEKEERAKKERRDRADKERKERDKKAELERRRINDRRGTPSEVDHQHDESSSVSGLTRRKESRLLEVPIGTIAHTARSRYGRHHTLTAKRVRLTPRMPSSGRSELTEQLH